MREHQPITKTMNVSETRQQLSQLLNQVFRGQTRIVVEKSGIPVAGIVSARDVERLEQLERERERAFAIVDEIREAFKDVPDEELEREVVTAVAAARQKRRTERGPTAQTR